MNTKNRLCLPALAMHGLVMFPKMVLHFDVGNEKSVAALRAAAEREDRQIFLVALNEEIPEDEFSLSELSERGEVPYTYKIGVIAEVRQILRTPENNTRVLVEGLRRARLIEVESLSPFMEATVSPLKGVAARICENERLAFMRTLVDAFKRYCAYTPRMPDELYQAVLNETDLEKVFEAMVFNLYLKPADRQRLLELNSLKQRAESLLGILEAEIGVMEIEHGIHEAVRESMEKNHREYYLREQMRVIARQLGEKDDPLEEYNSYVEDIEAIGFADDIEEKLINEADKLLKYTGSSSEIGTTREYLDTILDLPWNEMSKENTNVAKSQKQLDRDHYGLTKVKERITELFAVRVLNPDVRGQIICLEGPPGVGKTSVGKSIAKALSRKYARISLGGVRDEAEIRGHRKTYIGSMPGRIVEAIRQAKSMNPVILLDEIDKLCADYKGDPSAALLEVLDGEQNTAFVDHYLEIPMDLSKVLFIATANNADEIPPALLDRMDVIELGSYTRIEKFNIAKKHLIPKQLKKHGIAASKMRISNDGIYTLIDHYTREAGVRKLERRIAALCRKAAKQIVTAECEENKVLPKLVFTSENIESYLGVKKYNPEFISKADEVGIVNGLAWTSAGGVVMPLEVAVMEGSGKVEITGSLGDVMTESTKLAVSLVRTLAARYDIDATFYKDKDLHIHAPEGAVPKDGPSAGVAMITALVSALARNPIPVCRDVAMTGEITLHGKVLAIGGLKEKAMAAYKAGVKTVVIPKDNKADISELDEEVRTALRFVIADRIETVLETALVEPLAPKCAERGDCGDISDLKRKAEKVVRTVKCDIPDILRPLP